MDYHGKNYYALILGASSGFGLASAHKLAQLGFNIIAVHRDRKGAQERIDHEFNIMKSYGINLIQLNINALSKDGMDEVITTLKTNLGSGKIRTVLHSIALGNLKLAVPLKTAENTSTENDAATIRFSDQLLNEEDLQQTIYNMGTNLLFWVQRLHREELFTTDARVLGLTSEGNSIVWRGYGAVSAAKCALESIARTIAVEFAPYGIRCNILQPGVTDTPALRLIPGAQNMLKNAAARNPFGRTTTPEDVASVVGIMSSDEAQWINGTIIRVDGGEHIAG